MLLKRKDRLNSTATNNYNTQDGGVILDERLHSTSILSKSCKIAIQFTKLLTLRPCGIILHPHCSTNNLNHHSTTFRSCFSLLCVIKSQVLTPPSLPDSQRWNNLSQDSTTTPFPCKCKTHLLEKIPNVPCSHLYHTHFWHFLLQICTCLNLIFLAI